jgi:glycosyltransferase involved in cell wall biosynthesis
MTTITIVTPSYNQGRFIEDTIQSVISQRGNFYIDFIIMDGGSKDNTVDIIKKYEDLMVKNCEIMRKDGLNYYIYSKHKGSFPWNNCLGISYRWRSEKDKGQSNAINKGFKMAEGEIVSWLNSDDAYFSSAFDMVVNHFSKYPGDDFVYGDGDVVDEKGTLKWEWLSRPYDFSLMKSYHFLWNNFTNYIMQQSVFWRRSVFDRIGFLDESFHFAMDVEYWIRAGAKGLALRHIPQKLGKFRMISGTKSLSSPTAFWPDMLEIFRRYNGACKMALFFAYYFYNISMNNSFEMLAVWEEMSKIWRRWETLGNDEIEKLEQQAHKGFDIGSLLAMNRAFLENKKRASSDIFRNSLAKNCFLIFHPLTLMYMIKCLLGLRISLKINLLKKNLVGLYRQRKYQYRYLKRKKGNAG